MCWHQTSKIPNLNVVGETLNEMDMKPYVKNFYVLISIMDMGYFTICVT